MAFIKDMISSPKIQLLKAPFLVRLIATDHSEVIYDAKQNINPFWEILNSKRKEGLFFGIIRDIDIPVK